MHAEFSSLLLITILAAVVPFDPQSHFGSSADESRKRAVERTREALQRAAWLGAEILIATPAAVTLPDGPTAAPCSYEQALNGTYSALQRLRFAAQTVGVDLALVAGANRFLLSPIELRELLDEQHSPAVGACVDLHAPALLGWSEEWVRILRSRVRCVMLTGSEDREASPVQPDVEPVIRALRSVRFEGPICVRAHDEAEAVARAIETGQSP